MHRFVLDSPAPPLHHHPQKRRRNKQCNQKWCKQMVAQANFNCRSILKSRGSVCTKLYSTVHHPTPPSKEHNNKNTSKHLLPVSLWRWASHHALLALPEWRPRQCSTPHPSCPRNGNAPAASLAYHTTYHIHLTYCPHRCWPEHMEK